MGSDDGNAKKVKRKKRRSKQSRIHPSDSEASREEYTIDSHGNQSLTIEEEVNDSGDSPSSSNLLIKPKKSTTPYKSSILKAAAVTSFLGNGVTKGVKATSKAGKTAADDGMRNVMAAKRGARKFLALGKRQKQKSSKYSQNQQDWEMHILVCSLFSLFLFCPFPYMLHLFYLEYNTYTHVQVCILLGTVDAVGFEATFSARLKSLLCLH